MSDGTGQAPDEPRTWPPEAGRAREGDDAGGDHGEGGPGEAASPGGPEDTSAARIAELEDRWRRALADLDNHRKRTVRALDRERQEERAKVSAAWLPVLDDLERALEHAEADPGTVVQGVRAVLEHARQVIERLGYPRRDDEGEPFDPARHEAVSTVSGSGAPDGTVVWVVLPGYGEGAAQLRPARVVVAKGRDDGAGT